MGIRTLLAGSVLMMVGLLVGCSGAPKVPLAASDRASIKVVNLASAVSLPEKFNYQARGAGMGMMFGLLGALVEVAAASKEPPSEPAQILLAMKANNISFEEIVKAEFLKAAKAVPGMSFNEGASASDAELSLTLNSVGFGRTHLLGYTLHPTLILTAVMKRPDGTVIWQKTDYITAAGKDDKNAYQLEQYLQNPKLIHEVYSKAAASVSKWIVEGLPR
jgi:hypothetical protein